MTGRFFIRSLLIVLILFVIGIIFIVLFNQNLAEQEVLKINRAGFSLASKIEDLVNRPLSAAYALAAIIKTYGGFSSQQEFESIAQKITELYDGVSFLAAAPNAVTSFIYPLQGNEKAIGHDLLNDPQRRDDVLRAIQSRSLTLSGPYELVQGGVSILGRLPVFRDGTESDFWGLSVVSLDLSKLLYDLELDSMLDSGFLYEITRKDSPSDQETIIITTIGKDFNKKKYVFSLNLPNSLWYLHIIPKKNETYNMLVWEVLVLIIVLLIGFVIAYRLIKQNYDIKAANMELHMQIKEKERIELELIAAKKNAETANNAKSLFLANMSHEIKTPLNGIMGFISLLKKTSLDTEQQELVKQAEISGHSLTGLISDILDISKIEADKVELHNEPYEIRKLIEEVGTVFLPLVKEKNIKLSIKISEDTPKILELDTVRLKQILINLIGNAVK
ncbi:MAG TPA: histidine kinase dimerization/phospho-acceptor domain-containing protein, partial [Petrotogaceae bacterium]|nr:histidine kinase dimerization/phospho-acceptor domain-containing protein [Petrotogaceae bacterium]